MTEEKDIESLQIIKNEPVPFNHNKSIKILLCFVATVLALSLFILNSLNISQNVPNRHLLTSQNQQPWKVSKSWIFQELFKLVSFDGTEYEHYWKLAMKDNPIVLDNEWLSVKLGETRDRSAWQTFTAWPKKAIWEDKKKYFDPDEGSKFIVERLTKENKNAVHVSWLINPQQSDPDTFTHDWVTTTILSGGNIINPMDTLRSGYLYVTDEGWGYHSGYGMVKDAPWNNQEIQFKRWYPNFGDTDLFYAAQSWLMGQDEWITLEHPFFMAIRKKLKQLNDPKKCLYNIRGTKEKDVKISESLIHCHHILKMGMIIENIPKFFEIDVIGEDIFGDDKNKLYAKSGGILLDKQSDPERWKLLNETDYQKQRRRYMFGYPSKKITINLRNKYLPQNLNNFYILVGISNAHWQTYSKWKKRWGELNAKGKPVKMDTMRMNVCSKLKDKPDPINGRICDNCEKFEYLHIDDQNKIKKIWRDQRNIENVPSFHINPIKDGWETQWIKQLGDKSDIHLCYDDTLQSGNMYFWGNDKLYYTAKQYLEIFNRALATFKLLKSATIDQTVELHLGNWGGGIFKNNVFVVAAIQLMAARTVGIQYIIYHDLPRPDYDATGKKIGFKPPLIDQGKLEIQTTAITSIIFGGSQQITYEQLYAGFERLESMKKFAFDTATSFS